MENNEINEIIEKMKAEIRKGLAEKKMDITDVSMAMSATIGDVKAAIINEVEQIVNEDQDKECLHCPDCGEPLKKTAKSRKKKTS